MNDIEKLKEISRLLDEAYEHYFKYEGHCKSSEGYISIDYGNLWQRKETPGEMPIKNVHIYSYVFCANGERSQDFESLDEALETVRGWHAEEMAYDYESPEALENARLMDEMAGEFISKMMAEGRLTIINVGDEDDKEE